MATNVFLGLNGDWSNVNNWSLAAIPVDTDDVVIPDTTQTSLTTGLDRTGDSGGAGLDLDSITVHEGYGGIIGSLGNPLKCIVSGAGADFMLPSIVMRGPGPFHYNAEGPAGSANIVIHSRNMLSAFVLGGDKDVVLSCVGGKTIISAGYTGTIPRAYVTQTSGSAPVLQDQSATAITVLTMTAGTMEYDGTIGDIHLHGGVITANLASAVGSVYVSNGMYIYNASADTLNVLSLMGGTVDTTRTAAAKTIAALYKSAKGTLLRTKNLTVTTEYDLFDVDTD